LTVYENLCVAAAVARGKNGILALALRALRTPEIAAEVDAIIELFQISQYSDTPAAMLPQGARKLLDIAMAIGGSPRLLLLDEPTSGISVEEKFAIMDVVMSALRSRKITILFVEHDMQIVARFADRVLAFYDGTVIADGTPTTALANPQVQALISGANAGPREGAAYA
jgi:branched-chain amino acid transport system ATP-binding protein